MKPTVTAVVPAAGSATRMRGGDKILTPVNGLPLIGYSLSALEASPLIDEIIIAARDSDILPIAGLCKAMGFQKVSGILRGGSSRPHTVLKVLVETRADIVAIHDGARPCLSVSLCDAVIRKAIETGAAVPGLPITDTVKVTGASRIITGGADRGTLFTVQTPQCFETALIRGALAKALRDGNPVTDDSAAAEALPYPVHIVPGEARNIKVTTPDDLVFAEVFLRGDTV
ncbi:MAG: 2-C-methyl-D-erythritol 4-phosphate cytidylyltransferase [Oscillospiraceae bacterium]|jgi:2-C-methyl-D-erythritol 4-phosphate cytidylyltransferase|nr:2-C-methyl-D-erythritol 4-phosphate cytidylyltransferase [Oscillospiraceae bacterium]